MYLVALALCLAGCAGLGAQPGEAHASDMECGHVGRHQVRLRYGVGESWPAKLLSCEDALALVKRDAAALETPWLFLFTSGNPGFAFDRGMHGRPADAMTFTVQRVIETNVLHLGLLPHEVRHARHAELHEEDREDW